MVADLSAIRSIDISRPGIGLLFQEGLDYEEIDPRKNGGLKYILLQTFCVVTPIKGFDVTLKDRTLTIAEGLVARLLKDGTLIIYEGAMYDGASGGLDTVAAMLAALLHDVIYYMMRRGLLARDAVKDMADRLLQDVLYRAMIARLPELKITADLATIKERGCLKGEARDVAIHKRIDKQIRWIAASAHAAKQTTTHFRSALTSSR